MQTHVKVVAVLFLLFGGLAIVAAGGLALMFGHAVTLVNASHDSSAPIGAALLGLTGVALAVALTVSSVPALFCGWGLLRYRRWARLLGIILGALSLLGFPFGTIVGVYVLWVLLSTRSEPLFDAPPPSPGA